MPQWPLIGGFRSNLMVGPMRNPVLEFNFLMAERLNLATSLVRHKQSLNVYINVLEKSFNDTIFVFHLFHRPISPVRELKRISKE